jgi:hypothetical protein
MGMDGGMDMVDRGKGMADGGTGGKAPFRFILRRNCE